MAAPIDLGSVQRIETAISALGSGGAVGPIYNIGIDIFPRDASGLVIGWLIATDLDQLDPGRTFPFTTTGVTTSFSLYRVFTEFIDGPQPASGSGPAAIAAAGADSAIAAA